MGDARMKPCPFCGSEATLKKAKDPRLCDLVSCPDEMCPAGQAWYRIEPWNTRAIAEKPEVKHCADVCDEALDTKCAPCAEKRAEAAVEAISEAVISVFHLPLGVDNVAKIQELERVVSPILQSLTTDAAGVLESVKKERCHLKSGEIDENCRCNKCYALIRILADTAIKQAKETKEKAPTPPTKAREAR